VQFSATSIAGPAASVAFASPVVVLDSATSTTLNVTAHDKYGNVVLSPEIAYMSRSSDVASVSGDTMTAIAPGETFVAATAGPASDSMLIIASHAHGPVVHTDLTRFDLAKDTTITVGIVADLRSSGLKLGSATVTVNFDPALLALSSSTAAPAAVVNAGAASSGHVTIAAASAAGLDEAPTLATLTFKVVGAAGRSGAITLAASELTSQDFRTLTPLTFSASQPFIIR
jgi:hypothetical protein